ncbi:MAG TPA: hypothetical protein VIM70_08180 [Clostridium sp.]|uniref:hypothetical protein n=1 Tax=Clostridium sp. TaxID=1506 RepID=UPI002F958858
MSEKSDDRKRFLLRIWDGLRSFIIGSILFSLFWTACIDYIQWNLPRMFIDIGALVIVWDYIDVKLKTNKEEVNKG